MALDSGSIKEATVARMVPIGFVLVLLPVP